MDEDGNEPVKPTKELVAVDGQLAIIVRCYVHVVVTGIDVMYARRAVTPPRPC